MHRILFVCTANTCRSPLAEWILRRLAAERGLAIEVQSAGIFASPGAAMSNYSSHILRERGIDHSFGSQRVSEQLMNWADLVLTMTAGHKHELLLRHPNAAGKLFTLKEFVIDEDVKSILRQLDKLYADIEIQFSLGQPVLDEQRTRIRDLERDLPNLDVTDPFSGSMHLYEQCALDIEANLLKLLDRLQHANEQ
jgi:protein-tyrosine phosphatase